MAVRQYIGARYVIKVYENSQSASSAEWEANTHYEPLTMVTYQNSSYLSKKDVPATVGNPTENPSYWVITGAYNGQIAELQRQVTALQNEDIRLESVTKKKSPSEQHILIFGDSFTDDETDIGHLIQNAGIFKQVDLSVGGGRGFTGKDGAPQGTTGPTLEWLTYLKNYVQNHTEEELADLDAVYIMGGFNEIYSTPEVIEQHMSEFFEYAHEHLPVDYYLIEIGWCIDNEQVSTPQGRFYSSDIRNRIATKVIPTYAKAGRYGCAYLGNAVPALHNYYTDWIDPTESPYHPSEEGQQNLYECVLSMMLGGTYHRNAGLQVWLIRSTAPDATPEYAERHLGRVRIYKDTLSIDADGSRGFAYVTENVQAFNNAILDSKRPEDSSRYIAASYGDPVVYIPCNLIMPDNTIYHTTYYIDDAGRINFFAPCDITTTDRLRFMPLSADISILDC